MNLTGIRFADAAIGATAAKAHSVRDPAITKAEMLRVMANVRKPGCARSI